MSLFRVGIFLSLKTNSVDFSRLCALLWSNSFWLQTELNQNTSLVANGNQSSQFQLDANHLQDLKMVVEICEHSHWKQSFWSKILYTYGQEERTARKNFLYDTRVSLACSSGCTHPYNLWDSEYGPTTDIFLIHFKVLCSSIPASWPLKGRIATIPMWRQPTQWHSMGWAINWKRMATGLTH